MQPTYVEPLNVIDPRECWFYHVMDLPGLGTMGGVGTWDLRGRFDEYVGHTDVSGKTFLDVGTASGFLSFEAEKRGAIVTSLDIAKPDEFNYSPGADMAIAADYFAKLRNSYWLAHRQFGSRARVIYGDAHKLSELAPPSDIVMLGQILIHTRDPLEMIRQASLVARETIIIAEGSFESESPLAMFQGGAYRELHAWWHLSSELYRQWLDILGFEIVKKSKALYRCNHAACTGDSEIWTFRAQRLNA